MPYHLYIIYSASLDRYYVGHTESIEKRLEEHNSGISAYTSKSDDWELKYSEEFSSRQAARDREREVKRKKSRRYLEWLIQGENG